MRYAINLWHQAVVARGIRERQHEGEKTHNNNNRRQTSDITKGVEGRREEEETVYVQFERFGSVPIGSLRD